MKYYKIFVQIPKSHSLCGQTNTIMCQLQKQYEYFRRNMSSLLEDYKGKYLVISEALNVHVFDTIADAYRFGAKTYGLGNFLLQECDEEADKVQIITNLNIKVA